MTERSAESPTSSVPGVNGFSGQLSQTPLFVALSRVQHGHLSGTLSVFREDQVRQLFFEAGELKAARSSREDHRIGATLVRWGYISQKGLAEALEIQKETRQRIDQILVEQGLVTRAVIDSEARRQMEQIIFSTLAWPDGSFHFEPNTGAGELDVEIAFSADVLIESIRRIPESEQFVQLLGDLRSTPRVTRDPMNTGAFRLLKDAVDVLEHIDGKTSFDQLLYSVPGTSIAAAKILYSMMFAGLIEATLPEESERPKQEAVSPATKEDFGEDTQPVGRRAITEAAALQLPPGSSRQIVLETYRQLDWLSHYDLLGVSRKAPQSEIDQAYRAHALLFDPARKVHPELADLWKQLTVLARWLKVAHGVLSDPVKRAAYDKKIDETTPPAQGEAKP
ncbi:MAG TPA: DUF4388 domain-containing protein [Thermoanaerobaculia bacterium]|nr:DUF4388 domain-containing protein [Thermoanaerobaculia bacterium]